MSAADGPKRLRVELVTPEGPVFVEDARMVVVPGKAGELGVLPRHIALVAQLKPGETRVRTLDAADSPKVRLRAEIIPK